MYPKDIVIHENVKPGPQKFIYRIQKHTSHTNLKLQQNIIVVMDRFDYESEWKFDWTRPIIASMINEPTDF